MAAEGKQARANMEASPHEDGIRQTTVRFSSLQCAYILRNSASSSW